MTDITNGAEAPEGVEPQLAEPVTPEPEISVEETKQKVQAETDKLLGELTNLRKAKEEELGDLQDIREKKRLEKEQKELEELDPYSNEAIDKKIDIKARQAAREAIKEENLNKAGRVLMNKYGISYEKFKSKVLPRYTTVAGYSTTEDALEDLEAAIRAAMPEVITKAGENEIRSKIEKDNQQILNAGGAGSSETDKRQIVTKRDLSQIEKESMFAENQVRQRQGKPPLSENEFLKEYKLIN